MRSTGAAPQTFSSSSAIFLSYGEGSVHRTIPGSEMPVVVETLPFLLIQWKSVFRFDGATPHEGKKRADHGS
jgi:hypothetical protein